MYKSNHSLDNSKKDNNVEEYFFRKIWQPSLSKAFASESPQMIDIAGKLKELGLKNDYLANSKIHFYVNNFSNCNFRKLDLSNCQFDNCILVNADFQGANLSNTIISKDKINGIRLQEANLQGTEFIGNLPHNIQIDLKDVDFTGAKNAEDLIELQKKQEQNRQLKIEEKGILPTKHSPTKKLRSFSQPIKKIFLTSEEKAKIKAEKEIKEKEAIKAKREARQVSPSYFNQIKAEKLTKQMQESSGKEEEDAITPTFANNRQKQIRQFSISTNIQTKQQQLFNSNNQDKDKVSTNIEKLSITSLQKTPSYYGSPEAKKRLTKNKMYYSKNYREKIEQRISRNAINPEEIDQYNEHLSKK